jgi:spiro-SPASM protein
MANIAIVDGTRITDLTLESLPSGGSALDSVLAFARGLPEVAETIVLSSGRIPEAAGYRVESRGSWTVRDLFDALKRHGEGKGDIFFFDADCPLLDAALSCRMHANHRKYFADYTYADGYPYGLAPEILAARAVGPLLSLVREGDGVPNRETLFTVLKRDINAFDIETVIAPEDQRLLRASLTSDTRRNRMLLLRVMEKGGRDASSACAVLRDDPGVLRTLPAYVSVQIVDGCPQECSYCPFPRVEPGVLARRGFMELSRFRDILERTADFCGDATIGISLWGEPSLHPEIDTVIRSALEFPGLDLVIETSGLGWNGERLRGLRRDAAKAPTWIVSLDAHSRELYARLRGPGYEEAVATADLLRSLWPETTYVQAVRMKENEEDTEAFYRAWKAATDRIIVQKYDRFCGFLPNRSVADLSPLARFPCWHLQRDVTVLLDGTVPLCREDLRGAHSLGNLHRDGLPAVWEAMGGPYREHIRGEYGGPCAGCDEYYTYNF